MPDKRRSVHPAYIVLDERNVVPTNAFGATLHVVVERVAGARDAPLSGCEASSQLEPSAKAAASPWPRASAPLVRVVALDAAPAPTLHARTHATPRDALDTCPAHVSAGDRVPRLPSAFALLNALPPDDQFLARERRSTWEAAVAAVAPAALGPEHVAAFVAALPPLSEAGVRALYAHTAYAWSPLVLAQLAYTIAPRSLATARAPDVRALLALLDDASARRIATAKRLRDDRDLIALAHALPSSRMVRHFELAATLGVDTSSQRAFSRLTQRAARSRSTLVRTNVDEVLGAFGRAAADVGALVVVDDARLAEGGTRACRERARNAHTQVAPTRCKR